MIRSFNGQSPDIHASVYVHDTAEIIGRVTLCAGVSIWPYVVLRGDIEPIVVGEGSNIQDHTVIHTDEGFPTVVGRDVTVGHRVILHGCTVKDRALVGMGAIALTGALLEEGSFLGAGALLSPHSVIPGGWLALGVPAKPSRPLKPQETDHMRINAEHYRELMVIHERTSRPVARIR